MWGPPRRSPSFFDMNDDKTFDEMMSWLRAHLSTDGVSSANFRDGQLFMFTTEAVEALVRACALGNGHAVLFVKRGPTLGDPDLKQ